MLRRAQPVGRDVAHRHALRHVERDDDVRRALGRLPRSFPDLRTDEGDGDREQRHDEKRELRELSHRARRDQGRSGAAEGRERAAASRERDGEERADEDRREHHREELRARDPEAHGVLRNTVDARASSRKSRAPPRRSRGSAASS